MEKKTKYRIFPYQTYIGDMYLQFEDNGNWKFIPEKTHAYVTGKFLTIQKCPIKIIMGNESYFLSCFNKQHEYELVPFTKQYPNIQEYFDHLKIKRDEYLKENEEKKNSKIIYLQ